MRRQLERLWIRYIEGYWRARGVLPPTNYNGDYNLLFWALCEAPLSRRGIYLPQRTSGTFRTFFDEHEYIDRLVSQSPGPDRFFVDLGASDGIEISNVFQLCERGWPGLSVEADPARFARLAVTYARFPTVSLSRARITPDNVLSLLAGADCPHDFALLNVDLDSYDYYVLEAVLNAYRPGLVVAEINPLIPPPIRFTVLVGGETGSVERWFWGMSLSQLEVLAKSVRYDIVDLNGFAAFLVPAERNSAPPREAAELFDTGLRLRHPSAVPVPAGLPNLAEVEPTEGVALIHRYFADFEGRYICEA
jgi:hypothetical protein